MNSRSLGFVLAAVLVLPMAGAAQQSPVDSASGTARALLWTLVRQDYRSASELIDPLELRRTRLTFDSLLATDSSHYIALKIFRADSAAKLRGLSDVDFMASLLAFWFPASGTDAVFADVRALDVAGGVRRGNDTVLVVYRWWYNDEKQFRSDRVQAMVRCGGRWCAQSIANFAGLLSLLRPQK